MTKISLFVLAGLVSGSSSTDSGCSGLNLRKCTMNSDCEWWPRPSGGGDCRSRFSSFVRLEADEGALGVGHYLDQEYHAVDKSIDSSASGSESGYSGDGLDKYNYYYDYNLDYEDEDATKSYLRARK